MGVNGVTWVVRPVRRGIKPAYYSGDGPKLHFNSVQAAFVNSVPSIKERSQVS